ncbi:hypothetical protein B0H14DRAFT_38443 [Mycena olivaceomarginata]|nr:hypothetical protein B0H14DRAFT_38443 [Mycena olivaceomarginata]
MPLYPLNCASPCTNNASRSSSRSGVSSSSGSISMGCAPCAGPTIPSAPPRHSCRPPAPLTRTRKPSSTPAHGTQSTARTPAFAARQRALLLLPRARSAPALLLLTPAGGIRVLRPPQQRAPRVLREGRHHLRAAAVLFLPHLHTLHACCGVSPHQYASAPTPTPTYSSTLSPPMLWSVLSLPAPVCTSPTSVGKPVSSTREKRRSPVKGLFPFSLSSASSASAMQTTTPCPIRVSLPPLTSVDGDAPEEDDEDAWVDADDDDDDDDEGDDEDEGVTVVDDQDHAEDGDGELPTPVPWCSELLARPTLNVNVHICVPPAYYETGEGGGRRAGGREAEAVGHHVACYRHVRHAAPSAFPESSSVYVSEYCIHPRSLARHDCS